MVKYEITFKDDNSKQRVLVVEVEDKQEIDSWMSLLKKMKFAKSIASCKRKDPKEE
tara:strand:- start:312 stop:479 length:168 start_codon:yes stop_codon:yes gene_type:complete